MEEKNIDSVKSRLIKSVPIVAFLVFTCLFYGPLSLYLPNAEEIWFGLGTLMKIIIPFSIIVFALIMIFFSIIPENIASFLRKLLFGISLGLYIQGNWLGMDYGSGVLDGSDIPWDEYTTYGFVNVLIWVICITIPFVAAIIMNKVKAGISINNIITAVSLFLIAVQIPAMVVQLSTYRPNSGNLRISTDGMFDISDKENIIYIILDAMDEEYYNAFLEEYPEYVKELEGFTHFDNTLASGARTLIGVPSMFSGQPFMRQETYTTYLNEIWNDNNVFSELHESGYNVRVYSGNSLFTDIAAKHIDNFVIEDGSQVGSYKTLIKKIYKLDLFKFAPHFFKRWFMFNTSEFEAAKNQVDTYQSNDSKFYSAFRYSHFNVRDGYDKVFVVYHLVGAHIPFHMARDTGWVQESNLEDQVYGSFIGVKELLDDLKAKGIYDASTIIISGDHGDTNVFEWPLLLIKPKGEKGDYATSHVPASLFDIPIYLASVGGKELTDQIYGKDLFALTEGEERERHFFRNETDNTRVLIKEFVLNGDVWNKDELVEVGTYEDEESGETPYVLGTELDFTRDTTGNKYTVQGFSPRAGFRTTLLGRESIMSIPIDNPPTSGNLNIDIKLHGQSNESGPMEMYVGDNLVLETEANLDLIKSGIHVHVPVDYLVDDNRLDIRFVFLNEKEDSAKWTLSFESMVVS